MKNDIGEYIHIGKVLEVYPQTYTAMVDFRNSSKNEFGRVVECRVMALKLNSKGAASVSLPMPQDFVYVSTQRSSQYPDIIGYHLPTTATPRPSEFQHQLTPIRKIGGEDINFNGGTNQIKGPGPQDVLPGDQLTSGDEGQTLGVLTGGSIIAKASALCQMILTKSRSTMTLVARRFKLYSDFGEITTESENGVASLRIRGNTSVQKSNRYPGAYGINLRLGGEDLLNIDLEKKVSVVVDNSGIVRARMHSLQLDIPNGISFTNKSSIGSVNLDLSNIPQTITVGAREFTVVGRDYQTVRGKQRISVTGAASHTYGGAVRLTYNKTVSHTVKGVSLEATNPTAYEVNTGAGDVLFKIGNPALLTPPAPILLPTLGSFIVDLTAGHFKANTLLGDITLETTLGTATLKSFLKASIESAALAEIKGGLIALEAEVRMLAGQTGSTDIVVTALKLTQQILNKMIIMFNIHQHPPIPPLVGGPVLPPITQMQPILPLDIANKATLS